MKKQPRKIAGLYFLYQGDEIVYIGQANNVFLRVGIHDMENGKEFDSWSYQEIEGDRSNAEREAIRKHRPKYNQVTRHNPITGITSRLWK